MLEIAEYALLAHSMPGIAGSAQINHSGVLSGDPPVLVSGWSAGVSSSLASHSYSAISVSALRTPWRDRSRHRRGGHRV